MHENAPTLSANLRIFDGKSERFFMHKKIGIFSLIGMIIALGAFYNMDTFEQSEPFVESVAAPVKPTMEYGFILDSFQVEKATIKKGEMISNIFLRNGIGWGIIDKVAKKAKDVYSVKHIKVDNPYTILSKTDTTGKKRAKYLVYEISTTDYVVYDVDGDIDVYRGKKPIRTVTKTVSGTIKSSLYNALVDKNSSPLLAYALADVFAWQIDFYRVQKDDQFKVVYDEQYVGDKLVAVSKIHAAKFKHYSSEYYAFYFEQDGVGEYFDEDAGSLRKAFLKAPLKFTRISSRYSKRRFHPVQKRYKAHLGTDYAAPTGTPIMAVGDGLVQKAERGKYNGKYVKIKHNGTYTTQYLHMSKIEKGIRPGVRVRQGQVIGYVGSTGLATGPHLCYRFWKNGVQVDALKQKLPPSKPVDKEYRAAYEANMTKMKAILDELEIQEPAQLASIEELLEDTVH